MCYKKSLSLLSLATLLSTANLTANVLEQTQFNADAKLQLGYQKADKSQTTGGLKIKLETKTEIDQILEDSFANLGLKINASYDNKQWNQKGIIETLNIDFPIPTMEALRILTGRAYDEVYDNSNDFAKVYMDAGFGIFTLGFANQDMLNLANHKDKPKTRFFSYGKSSGLLPGLSLSYFNTRYFSPEDQQPKSNFFIKLGYDFSNLGFSGYFLNQSNQNKGYGSWMGLSNHIHLGSNMKIKLAYSQSSKNNVGISSSVAQGVFAIAASKISLDLLGDEALSQANILRFADASAMSAALETNFANTDLTTSLAYNQNKSASFKTVEFTNSANRKITENIHLKLLTTTITGDKNLDAQTAVRFELSSNLDFNAR